jgi:peptidoglycan/LPS O-acetylase OafA/YrhL
VSTRSVDDVPALSESKGHWADLDGLRACAILLVLGRHSLRPFISEDTYQSVVAVGPFDVTPLVLNGWIGVDLFFVLSGFLIGRQAWRGDSVRRFWFKRVTRILPAYWTCLAIVAIGLTMAGAWPKSGADFAAHLVMLQDYTGSIFVPSFWSLGAEEKFYLLAPLLVFVLARCRTTLWQGVSLLALWLVPVMWRVGAVRGLPDALSYADYFPQYRSPFHLTCESLVLGFAIAWMSRQPWSSRIRRPARELLFWGGAAGVMYCLVSSVILLPIVARTIILAPALIGLCFGAMVLAAVSGSGSYSAIVGRPMWRPLATGSYTLYLTHMMVLSLAAAVAARVIPLADGASLTARWMAFLPWYLAMTALSAYVLHRYVERPVLQWRDRCLQASPRESRPATIAEAA